MEVLSLKLLYKLDTSLISIDKVFYIIEY